MEARRRGASDTSAQKLGTDSPRRARAEKRGRSWRRSRGLGPRSQRAPSCGEVLGSARPSRTGPRGGRGAQPSPAPLTSGAASQQHGGGEGQQEKQQQAGEESHGAAGQRPVRVR